MDILYPGRLAFLGSGGAFGDALFFFCSGFTLFMKPMDGIAQFPNWYKRRINRIYPTVFAAAIIGCLFYDRHLDIIEILINSGWFVTCIMVYYIIIYFIGSYLKDKIYLISALVLLATGVWFFIDYQKPGFYLWNLDNSKICLVFFFVFMLLGAKMGKDAHKIGSSKPVLDIILLLVSVASYYILLFVGSKIKGLALLHYFGLFPLITSVYYLYRVFNSNWAERLYNNRTVYEIIRIAGGLCLEVYLIQGHVITDRLNNLFPINILIVLIAIFIFAYVTRCLARFLSQTVNDSPYNWNKIIERY